MTKEKYEKALALDMPFGEALERFAHTDPRELPEPKKAKKPRKLKNRDLLPDAISSDEHPNHSR
jgi:hypothetical protein